MKRYKYAPTALVRFYESSFAAWMHAFKDERPDLALKFKEDELMKLTATSGDEFENKIVTELVQVRGPILDLKGRKGDLAALTLEMMKAGHENIYQANLVSALFGGNADLLFKRAGPSALGDHHYEPADIKLAHSPKVGAILQLCCYAEILEQIQKVLPENMFVITGDGNTHTFRVQDFYHYYRVLSQMFVEFSRTQNKDQIPLPAIGDNHRGWDNLAQQILDDKDDLSLIAGMSKLNHRKLNEAGVPTLTALAQAKGSKVKSISAETWTKLQDQASLQLTSKGADKPKFKVLPHKDGVRRGLALLPPRTEDDIYFDMEGYPLIKGGLEYMLGAAVHRVTKSDIATGAVDDPQEKFINFWAYSKDQEKLAFENFVGWAFGRWKKNPELHIFHYGAYEVTALRRLMDVYGTCQREVEELLAHHVFVNLYTSVTQGLRVGTPSYSLKHIEKLYFAKRTAEVSAAADSMVIFATWLETKDGVDYKSSKWLKSIRDYNRDDCQSTLELADFLYALRGTEIEYVAPTDLAHCEDELGLDKKLRNQDLAQTILRAIPEVELKKPLNERQAGYQVAEVLGHALDFHRREQKPKWWGYYNRQEQNQEELLSDHEVLAGVRFVQSCREGGQLRYACSYDPSQASKVKEGDELVIVEHDNPNETFKCVSIDSAKSTILLSAENKNPQFPAGIFTLAAFSNINTLAAVAALNRLAVRFNLSKEYFGLPKALHDLLLRLPPDIKGQPRGSKLFETNDDLLNVVPQMVLGLNSSVLGIQGPPGAGKTYLIAATALKVLARGQTVAISSNGHKAIAKVIQEIDAQNRAQAHPIKYKAAKITSARGRTAEESSSLKSIGVPIMEDAEVAASIGPGKITLVGGTAFALCKDMFTGKFDYLIVDEASQVSLPNLMAMSSAARNILLAGDQMQLEQPIQGSHPGESGRSALGYLSKEASTFTAEVGIFLPISHRMHPQLCQFISDSFYQSKLKAKAGLESQVLSLPAAPLEHIRKTAGLLYVESDHEGNVLGSQQEVDKIITLTKELLRCQWTDRQGRTRPLTIEDILFVAPYNMQVANLKRALPGQAKVGSVDLFQGQEAPVVILSMCVSDAEQSPRGLDFLLSPNRMNVALSRAKTLAIVVGSPKLVKSKCGTIEAMRMLNTYCKIMGER